MPNAKLAVLTVLSLACSSTDRTSTGRTERETDSVIGQSQVPGAGAVQKAMSAQDSGAARAARVDSIAADQ